MHYVGAFTVWPLALSAIYTFNALPPIQQKIELNKSKHLPSSMKNIYHANIEYLHNNRPRVINTQRNTLSKQQHGMQHVPLLIAARAPTVSSNTIYEQRSTTSSDVVSSNTTTKRRRQYKKSNIKKKRIAF